MGDVSASVVADFANCAVQGTHTRPPPGARQNAAAAGGGGKMLQPHYMARGGKGAELGATSAREPLDSYPPHSYHQDSCRGMTMASESVFQITRHDPRRLAQERARLFRAVRKATAVGSLLEVGSTAVEGVVGKEDIDFALVVPRHQFAGARADLDTLFERDPQQISNGEYQGYKLHSTFDAAVQLLVSGSQYDTFDKFLNRLQQSASLRLAYNELKAKWNGQPMGEYRVAKREFIEAALTASLQRG
jgi:GrpB-like predicted nucleotidyltransferase (UPF0157 family)